MTAYTPIYTSITNVQSKTGLSNTEVDLTDDDIVRNTIEDAEQELELLTGRKFTDANSFTEFISIKRMDILENKQTAVTLSNFPLLSITEFKTLDSDGNAITTYDTVSAAEITAGTFESDDYWLETQESSINNALIATGVCRLKTATFPQGTNNVKVAYTYGYSSVPVVVRNLATCLAGIRCWLRFIGASYNRLNSYGIPQQNTNKGDFYQRGMQNIQMLTDEAEKLLDRIGRKPRTLFFASGAER